MMKDTKMATKLHVLKVPYKPAKYWKNNFKCFAKKHVKHYFATFEKDNKIFCSTATDHIQENLSMQQSEDSKGIQD